MALTHLGKSSHYIDHYTPSLLEAIPRDPQRESLGIISGEPLPFFGADLWNGYEVSWLNEQGKPEVAILECRIPCTSPSLVESKSFKLYLNSYCQSRFRSMEVVGDMIRKDLNTLLHTSVDAFLAPLTDLQGQLHPQMTGTLLDPLPVVPQKTDGPELLCTKPGTNVRETVTSNLLKSNCPVTGQPDWGSVQVQYEGEAIDHHALLRYIIHFHHLQEFHEHCVERMFLDIMQYCKPRALTVYARYTRRGGLDINPYRSTSAQVQPDNVRLVRQ